MGVVQRLLIYFIIFAALLLVMFPLLWMLSASLKPNSDIFVYPPKWIPNPPLFSNYARGLATVQFFKGLKNTLLITIPCVIGQTISCSLVAYGLSRFHFRGRGRGVCGGVGDDDAARAGDADSNVHYF